MIVKMDEKGERIPLTICDYDREAGTITIVIQTVGASTEKMVRLKAESILRTWWVPWATRPTSSGRIWRS